MKHYKKTEVNQSKNTSLTYNILFHQDISNVKHTDYIKQDGIYGQLAKYMTLLAFKEELGL